MTNDQHETNLMVMTLKAFRKKKKGSYRISYYFRYIATDIILQLFL